MVPPLHIDGKMATENCEHGTVNMDTDMDMLSDEELERYYTPRT